MPLKQFISDPALHSLILSLSSSGFSVTQLNTTAK